jgi:hypothetical protein
MRSHNINRLNITRIHNAIWHPPLSPWIKCNTGSAAIGSPLNAVYGGIFQNSEGDCIGCFVEGLGSHTISIF